MKGFFTILLIVATVIRLTAADNSKQPLPLQKRFEPFILLSAGSSELRLFIPEKFTAAPHRYMSWEKDLDVYSQKWAAKKNHLTDAQLLRQLFQEVHHHYLKHYTPYTGVEALLENGEYNCVSATAFYALLLDRLGYNYRIVESNNHVVLVAAVGDSKFLFETTDPFNGFIDTTTEVNAYLNKMKAEAPGTRYYNFNLRIFRTISLRELAGLQFYNSAAWYYNHKQPQQAAEALRNGEILYQTKRFSLFKQLLAEL